MPIVHQFIEIETREGIDIFDITPQVVELLESTSIRNGQVLVFSQHTKKVRELGSPVALARGGKATRAALAAVVSGMIVLPSLRPAYG